MGVVTASIWRIFAILCPLATLSLTSGFVFSFRLSLAPLGNLAVNDQTFVAQRCDNA